MWNLQQKLFVVLLISFGVSFLSSVFYFRKCNNNNKMEPFNITGTPGVVSC